MAGHSRPKDGVASARLCPGHPRLSFSIAAKTWMPGTRPGMTSLAIRLIKHARRVVRLVKNTLALTERVFIKII
jgi:hypothetical protein